MMRRWTLFTVLLVSGCATTALKGGKDADLVGVRAPLLGDGMTQAVYFTHLDGRELRNLFNQYPSSLRVSPGEHTVTVVCEWRESASVAPVAKHVRRYRLDLDAARTYQFESSFEGAGTCQLGYRDVTDQKTAGSDGR
jgi:hypothetical protein